MLIGGGGFLPQGKTELIKCSNIKGLKNMVGHQHNTPLTTYGKYKQLHNNILFTPLPPLSPQKLRSEFIIITEQLWEILTLHYINTFYVFLNVWR